MGTNDIQHFALYGEVGELDNPDFVHIENIDRRSRLYDGNIRPHVHTDLFQLIFIEKGKTLVTIEKQQQHVAAPCVITLPPGTVHGFVFEPDTQGEVLTFSGSLPLTAGNLRSKPVFEHLYTKPLIIDLSRDEAGARNMLGVLEQITKEHAWPNPGRELMLEHLVQILLLHLNRRVIATSKEQAPANPSLEVLGRFRLLVEQHYLAHWDVCAYAEKLGLTESRLTRLCRSNLDKTPLEIIHRRLILEAERRLIYTVDPVSMIAYDLGFKDPAYFARLFKRRTGLTAGEYRKQRKLFKSE
jgi:AraC family transcriptional activator of pobA